MKPAYLALSLALSTAFACARHESTRAHSVEPQPAIAAAPAAPRAGISAKAKPQTTAPSIYDLSVRLTDDEGAVRSLDTFRGHPVLITMFYATCRAACPLLTSELKKIERQIPEPLRSDVRVLMVSFDASRDTPEVMSRLKAQHGMDPKRWALASATDDEARELASVLDIRYRKLDNGEYFHSSVIVMLDGEGRPQARLDGLGNDSSQLLAALTLP
jgi:protein SCO1/2